VLILWSFAKIPLSKEDDGVKNRPTWKVRKPTVLRRLQGITYWVAEDPEEIRDFINTNLRREWEEDLREEGRTVEEDQWLRTLSGRRWRLEAVEAAEIVLNPEIMNFVDQRRNYSFQASLAKRREELRTVLDTFGGVTWPVVARDDMVLMDGYCRFTALREMGISQIYAYVGSLE